MRFNKFTLAAQNAAFAHERDLRDKAPIKYDGIQEGIQVGIKEGIQLNQLQNAQAMLKDHVTDELILKYIGIRSDQLNSLKAQIASSLIQESINTCSFSSIFRKIKFFKLIIDWLRIPFCGKTCSLKKTHSL